MDYIQKLKSIRQHKHLTQTEVSRMLGFSVSTYGLYETYRRSLDVDTLTQLCRMYNVSADYILGLKDEQNI